MDFGTSERGLGEAGRADGFNIADLTTFATGLLLERDAERDCEIARGERGNERAHVNAGALLLAR